MFLCFIDSLGDYILRQVCYTTDYLEIIGIFLVIDNVIIMNVYTGLK